MTTVLERPTTATDAPVVDKRVVRRRLGPGKRIPFSLAIGPILLVGLWCLMSWTGRLDPRTLSEPWVVVQTAWDLIESGRLQDALKASAVRAFAGLGLGTVDRQPPGAGLGPEPGGRGRDRRPDPGQAGDPHPGAAAPAGPLARHHRGDEDHHHRARRDAAGLHPHPQRAAQHRRSLRRARGDRRHRPPGVHPERPAAGSDAGLPAGHAVRGHHRAAVAGRGRADQLDQRHRLHDHPRVAATGRPRSSWSVSWSTPCSGWRPTAPSASSRGRRSHGDAPWAADAPHRRSCRQAAPQLQRGRRGPQRARPGDRAGRVRGADRPQRQWQEHAAAGAGRAGPRRRRSRLDRRTRPGVRGLPGLHGCCRGAGCSTTSRSGFAAGTRGSAASRRCPRSAWPAARRRGRTSCPGASSSGPHWPARWSATRSCCWRTSRSELSTR